MVSDGEYSGTVRHREEVLIIYDDINNGAISILRLLGGHNEISGVY